jgi:hypothetical protein
MDRAWRWFAAGFAIAMCVVAGVHIRWGLAPVDTKSFYWLGYICPLIFYLAFAFGYLRVRGSKAASHRWLNLLLLISVAQSLELWSPEWESGALPRVAFWLFLAAALVVGFRRLNIADDPSPSPAWFHRLRTVPIVVLVVGAVLVVSSLFLQVTFTNHHGGNGPPPPTGWRLLLRQVRWVTAEIGLTRDIDDRATGIPSVVFDVTGYVLYAVAIVAALATLVCLVRARFGSARLRSSRILPAIAAATMFSALWSVSDIYWGWQLTLDRVRWAAWLGFTCWTATLGFGLAAVLGIVRAPSYAKNLGNLLLLQVPLALFNFFMVPDYIHDSLAPGWNILPLAGLGLLLLGLQMQSWACASLLMGRSGAGAPNEDWSESQVGADGNDLAFRATPVSGETHSSTIQFRSSKSTASCRRRRRMRSFIISLALMITPGGLPGSAHPEDARQTYRVFSVVSASDLEQTLNRFGAEGYRVASLSPSSGGDVAVVMEAAAAGAKTYQYRVPFGGHRHVQIGHNDPPLLDSINEAGDQGFRFVPGSIVFDHGVSSAVVLERELGTTAQYQYLIFAPLAISEGRFEQSTMEGEQAGFHVVFHGIAGTAIITLMEKQNGTSATTGSTGSNRFVRCSAKDLAKRYQEEVARGYVPLRGSLLVNQFAPDGVIYFWLQKASSSGLRVISDATDSKRDVSERIARLDAFLRELNRAAGEGYRLSAPPMLTLHAEGQIHRKVVATFNAVMQPGSEDAKVTYRLVNGDTLPELAERINEAAKEGFRVIPGTMAGNDGVFMEKIDKALSAGAGR